MCGSPLLRILKTGSFSGTREGDWDILLAETNYHRVTELIALLTRNSPKGTIPEKLEMYLKQAYKQTLIYNLFITAETEIILKAMYAADIECIILKGISLAERIYGDVGVRKSSDIDLLVKRDDLAEAVHILLQNGYSLLKNRELIPVEEASVHHYNFGKETGNCRFFVELHFHFTSRRNKKINMTEIWERSKKVDFGKAKNRELAPQDLLLHMCIHSSSHGYQNMRQVLDIDRVVRVEGVLIDWPLFTETVKRYGVSNRVYTSLYYTAALLDTPVPQWVLDALRAPKYLRRRITRECLPKQLPYGLTYLTWMMVRHEDLFGLTIYFWRIFFPPISQLRRICGIKRPSPFDFLYYPVRLVRYIKKLCAG